jgi:hypothetical protein
MVPVRDRGEDGDVERVDAERKMDLGDNPPSSARFRSSPSIEGDMPGVTVAERPLVVLPGIRPSSSLDSRRG